MTACFGIDCSRCKSYLENNYNLCIECNDYPCNELQYELDHNHEARENLEKLKQGTI